MRFKAAVALYSNLVFAQAALAYSGASPDTLKCEFLFYSQDKAYVRCDSSAGRHDSVWCLKLGKVLGAIAPIWEFESDPEKRWHKGDTITVLSLSLPRRAAHMSVYGGHDAWDPVQMRTSAAWAMAPLFHRALFSMSPEGQLSGDLARTWEWRGHDLVIVIDTSARFGDGSQIDAYAAKISLERYFWYVRDVPEYSWHYSVAGVENYRKGRTGTIVGLIPRGRDTLQINLVRPNFSIAEHLASPTTAIVKWTRLADGAPVIAAAGYYGTLDSGEAADIFPGRDSHSGSLLISHQVADRVWLGDQADPPCLQTRVPAPRLLILRPLKILPDGMLSFLDWAIDRKAVASEADRDRSYYGGTLPVWWAGERPREPFVLDYQKAQAARKRLPGRPGLVIAFARGLEKEAQYVVTALKAWDVRASYATSAEDADVRLELWDFETFAFDTQLERAFAQSGLVAGDSLVDKLQAARSSPDELKRSALYRSLRSRFDERDMYVVLLQHDALITACGAASLECARDRWGRYVGPFFKAEPGP